MSWNAFISLPCTTWEQTWWVFLRLQISEVLWGTARKFAIVLVAAHEHPATTHSVHIVLNYFQAVECKDVWNKWQELKKFERLTESNQPLVLMTASIHARRQQCSASTWCTQPTAWAQQATAHTAFHEKNNTPLLQRSKIKWAETIQSRHEKWIAFGSTGGKSWNGGHSKAMSLSLDKFLNSSEM